eukprot:TRINITY_DN346_c1_g1_i1.p1 TRINITY_DN346_c1_g1~~TRINITY_DN346_c1_g1_i1.p1  ORF type:complete len:361 (+),score=49.85 TRINITY_DN346_c1_g1_i1:41-1084(+)
MSFVPNKWWALALLALVIGVLAIPDFHGDTYQRQSAATKLSQLWQVIVADTNSAPWPSAVQLAELLVESMKVSFDTVADDMPRQFLDLQVRPKLIHCVGAVASCKFTPSRTNPYTGLLYGFDHGLIRFSLAAKPDYSAARGFIPGIGLKVLVDGRPSVNLVSMYNLAGQENSHNFFAHDFTNHVPYPDPSTQNIVAKKLIDHFKTASAWPTFVGIRDFANYNQTGRTVQRPRFPFRLVFHPTYDTHKLIPDNDDRTIGEMLTDLPIGPVYEVWAEDSPGAPLVNIGLLSTTSRATPSLFGDQGLFLEHQRMENDFEVHPQWVAAAQRIIEQQSAIPYYSFPDLPFRK